MTFIFFFRRQFCKSTTCDISSDEILPNETNLESSKSTPMNRTRHGCARRFSLVKLEVTPGDSHTLTTGFIYWKKTLFQTSIYSNKDDSKASAPSSSPNLIQKLLFRQFSPKTRPYSVAIAVSYPRKKKHRLFFSNFYFRRMIIHRHQPFQMTP